MQQRPHSAHHLATWSGPPGTTASRTASKEVTIIGPTTVRHQGAKPLVAAELPAFARHRPFALVLLVTGVVGWVASTILVLE